MMLVNFVRLAIKNIKKNKLIFFSSIFLMLSLTLLIMTLSLTKTFKQFFLNDNYNNLNHRTFFVSPTIGDDLSEMKKKLSKIKNINQVGETYEYLWNGYIEEFKNNDYNGFIGVTGLIAENIPTINEGSLSLYENKDDVIEIVCPDKLMPDYNIMFDSNWKEKKVINSSDYFNRLLTMKENDLEFYYKIIATYDTEINNADEYQCYTHPQNIYNLYKKTTDNLSGDGYLIAIVDKYDNVDVVLEEITKLGYNYMVVQETSDDFVANIFRIGTLFSTFMLIITILIIFINYGKMIKSRNYELYMLKVLGYDFKQIKLLLVIENILASMVAFICSIVISIIGLKIFQLYLCYSSVGNSRIDVYFSWNALLISLILSILLPTISILISFIGKQNNLVAEIK